jgi:hypothetical protein
MGIARYRENADFASCNSILLRRFNSLLKNTMVSCSLLRGQSLRESFEEACVLWLRLNSHDLPEFDRKAMYLENIRLLRIRKKKFKQELKEKRS